MSIKPLPMNFILERVRLSWRDALWGYEHQWLGWRSLVDLATSNLTDSEIDNSIEAELASVQRDKAWRAGELVRHHGKIIWMSQRRQLARVALYARGKVNEIGSKAIDFFCCH